MPGTGICTVAKHKPLVFRIRHGTGHEISRGRITLLAEDSMFEHFAARMATDLMKHFDQDVPQYLADLLALERKKDLKKIAARITIKQRDFSLLITNCQKIGYLHQIRYNDFIPSHLSPTKSEMTSMGKKDEAGKMIKEGRKAISKIASMFDQRRYLVAHAFRNSTRWHIFYFDQRDTKSSEENHWQAGAHIHFVNDLWPNLDPSKLWEDLGSAKGSVAGALHIKFDHPKQEEANQIITDNDGATPHRV